MKQYHFPSLLLGLWPQSSENSRTCPAGGGGLAQSKTFLFKAMIFLAFISAIPIKTYAQCPSTTYSVGSGVGFPNLSTAPAGVATLTAGQSILVTGTFTVDAGTWSIISAQVYLATNLSEVIVNSGTTLDASAGSIFEGCNTTYKWSAVRVLSGGTILADNCIFRNGLNAVLVLGNSNFHLTNNRFETCTNGLRIFGLQNPVNHTVVGNFFVDAGYTGVHYSGTNVVLGYNTFSHGNPFFPTPPSSIGVLVVNGKNLLIDDGTMINLNRGLEIATTPTSHSIEMKSVVFSGNTGVYTERAFYGLYIHDCTIRAIETAIHVRNHISAQTPPAGIANGDIRILRNVVSSINETCIRVYLTNGDGTISINANTILTEVGSVGAFQYYGVEIATALNARVLVEYNNIQNQGGSVTNPGAIYLYNCKKENTVSYNTIVAAPFGVAGDLVFGITAVGSPHFLARNNSVDGGMFTIDRAISIENPMEDVDLCCNTMTRGIYGLYMLGAHEDCYIQTSDFGALDYALYYDMVSSSGATQFHHGNDWSGANTTWDGYFNGNPFLAPAVEYKVNPSLLPNLLTKIFVTGGTPSDWFSTPSSTELNCSSDCGNGFAGDGGDELTGNDYRAMRPLEDDSYAVLQAMSQRHLYAKLLANPALLQDSEAAAFFEAAEQGNLGKLYAIEVGIATLYDPEINPEPSQTLADLIELNASISPTNSSEGYEKDINTLYLGALEQDSWTFSTAEQESIDDIAALCPQEAGVAVYMARLLQEGYRMPTWNTDCAFVGERSAGVAVENKGVKVYPNPAHNTLNIEFETPNLQDGRLEVFSLMGQRLRTQEVPSGTTIATLPLHELPNGVYLLRVMDTQKVLSTQKFTVQH